MSLKEHLRHVMLADTNVSSKVDGKNIFSGRAPQGLKTDFVVVHAANTDFYRYLTGTDETSEVRLQLDCVSDDSDRAESLAKAVIDALKNYTGTYAGNKIQGIEVTNDLDDNWSDDVGLYRRIVDIKVSYSE